MQASIKEVSRSPAGSSSRRKIRVLAYAVSAFSVTSGARLAHGAVTETWSGATNASWSVNTNWTNNIAPVNNGSLDFTGTTNTASYNDISSLIVAGITFDTNAGAFTLSGNSITLSGSAGIVSDVSTAETVGMNINLNAGSGNFTGELNVAGIISNDGGIGVNLGRYASVTTDVLTFSGLNTYTGPTTIYGVGLSVSNIGSLNAAGNLGENNNINFGPAAGSTGRICTLDYNGAGETTDKVINLNAAPCIIDTTGASGGLVFTSNVAANYNSTSPTHGLTLQGNSTGNAIEGVIGDTVGPSATYSTAITKAGTGQWILTASNTYSGTTTISAGNLQIANASGGSALGSGPVAVSGGTSATLSGTGYASGTVTVSNNSRIAPGTNGTTPTGASYPNFGTASTLTLGSTGGLILGVNPSPAYLDFDLAALASGTSDEILTAALSLYSVKTVFNGLGASVQVGTPYVLIHYTGTETGTVTTAFTNANTTFVGTLAGHYSAAYSLDAVNDNVDVTFTATPEPASLALLCLGGLSLMRRRRRRAQRRGETLAAKSYNHSYRTDVCASLG